MVLLDISINEVSSSSVYVSFIVSDLELANKIVENMNRNIHLIPCKNCTKLMIDNSPTHKICWRCRNKDRKSENLVEI